MFDAPTTKEEADERYGKRSFWLPPANLLNKALYLHGSPAFDAVLERSTTVRMAPVVFFWDRGDGLEIQLAEGLGGDVIDVPNAFVEAVALEDREQITALKEKSVIGRALVGGLLLGPVGALVGGMSGIGKKAVVAETPDNLLTLWCSNGETRVPLVFSLKQKHRADAERFFRKKYGPVCGAVPAEATAPSDSAASTVDQLERLATLLDRGALTASEFEAEKARLLQQRP